MDIELIDRLVEWLAFFLSQQDFAWDWESWTFVLDQPDYSIQKVFVRNLLSKCSNITHINSFLEMLPESFQVLINDDRKGVFKYVTETKENYDAQIILDAMSNTEDVFSKGDLSIEASGDTFVEIFMECLLYKSQKSLRHLKLLVDRFKIFIQAKLSEESAQVKALETVNRVWKNNDHKEVSIFDQLLHLQVISPITMIK